ncbi:hypothetical protein [Nostoc sp.]|uniref:hypothetical protein n=1 Tax=Nostoc sp. TaxID=1180 RepID=UPI002FF83DA6
MLSPVATQRVRRWGVANNGFLDFHYCYNIAYPDMLSQYWISGYAIIERFINMTIKHGKQRTSEVRQRCEGSELEGESRSLGTFSRFGGESGTYPLSVTREDCNKPDTVVSGEWTVSGIPGKLISQLIDETEKQLAYYEQQSEALRERLKELKQIPENLQDISHQE